MKKLLSILCAVFIATTTFAQTTTLPKNAGDNFSLEGALALFKKSKSIEEFEILINEESNNVTNLDLNNDGTTDYIAIEDITDTNSHVLVLSIDLNANTKQDIATINIEKTSNEQAILQIIGAADLYPENTIVEPFETTESIQISKGPNAPKIEITQLFVNVWFWPSVQFIYAPSYVTWRSPYRWAFYPKWYRPWKPFGYRTFYVRCAPHRIYYHKALNFRVAASQNLYKPRRQYNSMAQRNQQRTKSIKNNSNRSVEKTIINRNKEQATKYIKVKNNRSRANGRR